MAVVKLLAKEFPIEVNGGTEAVPDWLHISGVNSVTITTTKNTVDTRDYDSGSWMEHMAISRGATISIDGQRMQDPADGARDPGQEEVELYAWEVGAAAEAHFRVLSPGGDPYGFTGTVNVTPFGGTSDELATWDVEIEVTGALALMP